MTSPECLSESLSAATLVLGLTLFLLVEYASRSYMHGRSAGADPTLLQMDAASAHAP